MSDAHHDYTLTSMHCVCLENEVDELRGENARLRTVLNRCEAMTEESMIEWAAAWVPDEPPGQRARFVDGLRREAASLKRSAFGDGYAFGLEHGSDDRGDLGNEAWSAYTSSESNGGEP